MRKPKRKETKVRSQIRGFRRCTPENLASDQKTRFGISSCRKIQPSPTHKQEKRGNSWLVVVSFYKYDVRE
jgi:hypothetical protein